MSDRDQSRYGKYSKYRNPKDKRVLRLYGEKTDTSRWYHCWNCGFMIDSNRTASGGQGSGIGYVASSDIGYPVVDPDLSVRIEIGGGFALMELGPDGLERGMYTDWAAESGRGCPLCGTLNYR